MRKATRRKSLQDLIGTVGGTFSRRHRHNTRGSVLPWREDRNPGQDSNVDQNILPPISPDPAICCPPVLDDVFVNLSILDRECQYIQAENDRTRTTLQQDHDRSHWLQTSVPVEFQRAGGKDDDGNHVNVDNNQQILGSYSYAGDTLEISQLPRPCELPPAYDMQKPSRDVKEVLRRPSLDILHQVISTDSLQNINPAVPLHVK